MPLIIAPEGKEMKVVKVVADDKLRKYLESLGVAVNSIIKVVNFSGNSTICCVKEGRLAFDRATAAKIMVV